MVVVFLYYAAKLIPCSDFPFFLVLSLFHYAFILLMSVCHSEASPIISLT